MWHTKLFKTEKTYTDWIIKNENKYYIVEIFVNNYYRGVEYKKLRTVY